MASLPSCTPETHFEAANPLACRAERCSRPKPESGEYKSAEVALRRRIGFCTRWALPQRATFMTIDAFGDFHLRAQLTNGHALMCAVRCRHFDTSTTITVCAERFSGGIILTVHLDKCLASLCIRPESATSAQSSGRNKDLNRVMPNGDRRSSILVNQQKPTLLTFQTTLSGDNGSIALQPKSGLRRILTANEFGSF